MIVFVILAVVGAFCAGAAWRDWYLQLPEVADRRSIDGFDRQREALSSRRLT